MVGSAHDSRGGGHRRRYRAACRSNTYTWIAPIDFDVDRFVELCAAPHGNGASSEALPIYRGAFLEGDFDDWVTAQRERLAAHYEALLSRAAAASKDVAASETLIGRNPYDETAYTTLIEAELRASRPQSASILVERYRALLAEMDVQPSAGFEGRFGSLRRPESTNREFRPPFVARTTELGELGQRLTAAAGSGSVTVVHGDRRPAAGGLPERDARLAALQYELALANYALFDLDAAARGADAAVALSRARGELNVLAGAQLLRAHIAAVVRTPVERGFLAREAVDSPQMLENARCCRNQWSGDICPVYAVFRRTPHSEQIGALLASGRAFR